jgi:hypothetical protein
VLHHHDRLFFGQALQDAGRVDALINIKIRADLIKEIEIRVARGRGRYGYSLQLAAAEA